MWSEIGKHRVVTDFIGHVIKKNEYFNVLRFSE